MSLTTDLYTLAPIPLDDVLACVLPLILNEGQTVDQIRWVERSGRKHSIDVLPGQGLRAWVDVSEALGGGQTPENWDDGRLLDPAHYVCLSMDTSYAYDTDGESCGALHARIIEAVGKMLQKRGIEFIWHNDYTDEFNPGFDGLDSDS